MPGKHPREKSVGKEKRKKSRALKVKLCICGSAEDGPIRTPLFCMVFSPGMRSRCCYVRLCKTISPFDVLFFLLPFLSFFFSPHFLICLEEFAHFIILTKACRKIFNGFKAAYETEANKFNGTK